MIECFVCGNEEPTASIGRCNHPVCMKCTIQHRVFLHKRTCPECDQRSVRAVFVETLRPYESMKQVAGIIDGKAYGLLFENAAVKQQFEKLMTYSCKICSNSPRFRKEDEFYDHMKYVHNLHDCKLCSHFKKILPSERRFYSTTQMWLYRRNRRYCPGHPICSMCKKQFMDESSLTIHVHRAHGRYLKRFETVYRFQCKMERCEQAEWPVIFSDEDSYAAHMELAHGQIVPRNSEPKTRRHRQPLNVARYLAQEENDEE